MKTQNIEIELSGGYLSFYPNGALQQVPQASNKVMFNYNGKLIPLRNWSNTLKFHATGQPEEIQLNEPIRLSTGSGISLESQTFEFHPSGAVARCELENPILYPVFNKPVLIKLSSAFYEDGEISSGHFVTTEEFVFPEQKIKTNLLRVLEKGLRYRGNAPEKSVLKTTTGKMIEVKGKFIFDNNGLVVEEN